MWSFTTGDYSEFAGGSGIESDPYQVATAEHLNNVRNHLDAHFVQIADIDLAESPYSSGWISLANDTEQAFSGTYDGNGQVILNLYMGYWNYGNRGVFGKTEGATISNLGLINIEIHGKEYINCGGIASMSYNTHISNCYSSGSVTGDVPGGAIYTGGLVGYLSQNSVMENCYSTSDIIGNVGVGGLIGASTESVVSNSFASGSVTGYLHVGGLIGTNYSSVTNCYATGNVTGTTFGYYVGGLIGGNYYADAVVTNCYSTGWVSGNSVEGMIGYQENGTTDNSFWDFEN